MAYQEKVVQPYSISPIYCFLKFVIMRLLLKLAYSCMSYTLYSCQAIHFFSVAPVTPETSSKKRNVFPKKG